MKRTTVKRTSCPGCREFTGTSWPEKKGVCFACGCSEARACVGGCSWTDERKRLCTACAKQLCTACAPLFLPAPAPGLEQRTIELLSAVGLLEKRMGTLEQVVNVELQHVDVVVPKGVPSGTTISGDHFHLWESSSTRSPPCAELLLTSAHVTLSASDLRALGEVLFAMARQLEPPVPPARAASR